MKEVRPLFVALCLATACGGGAPDTEDPNDPDCEGAKCDVIGDDDRYDEFSGEVTDLLREVAASTAVIVERQSLVEEGDRTRFDGFQTLGDTYMMCDGERFREQISAGFCSAWLVAPDIMVTNGHCITSQQACEQSSFVFDFTLDEETTDLSTVPSENVVGCHRVLAWDSTLDCEVDFAVVQLEHPVDRTPLEVRGSASELTDEPLVIIGHPFGLPRKYALEGELLKTGDNSFTTTHDIFGGNSGSAIFAAETGVVQGLVTCGGSNLEWEYIDDGWTLDRKTGQPCEATCDTEGVFTNGSWEECSMEGTRRRCVCADDGSQLVWEKRECMPFETESEGTCSREAKVSLESCRTAPWKCSTPTSQHTRHFAQFTEEWSVYDNGDDLVLPQGQTVTSPTLTIPADTLAQGFTVYVDLIGASNVEELDLQALVADLDVTLENADGSQSVVLTTGAVAFHGTAMELGLFGGQTQPFQVPFVLHEFADQIVGGDWSLRIANNGVVDHQLYGWRIGVVVADGEDDDFGLLPCVGEGCVAGWEAGPEPFEDSLDQPGVPTENTDVPGTVAEGWSVEVLDPNGTGYEAVKTRRSQTISLETGELALIREFGEDIGSRTLEVDYRYDGDGWFQIKADGQIIYAQQAFSQETIQVALPFTANRIEFVLGATDGSQFHEATIFGIKLLASTQDPASCESVYTCVANCGDDTTCQDTCIAGGSADAQSAFWALIECMNTCDPNGDQQVCVDTQCASQAADCVNAL